MRVLALSGNWVEAQREYDEAGGGKTASRWMADHRSDVRP
jgi:hypothetical protein